MRKIFNSNYVNKLTDEIFDSNAITYEELPKYDLFLSQVVEFLNNKFDNKELTSNIVQNYIKNEVITKPEHGKKRGYTKVQLIQLILISYMRPLLSVEEIKKVFKLVFNDINDTNDDVLSLEEIYRTFMEIEKEGFDKSLIPDGTNEIKFKEIINEFNLDGKDEERIGVFLLVLSLLLKVSVIKQLIQKTIDEYEEN